MDTFFLLNALLLIVGGLLAISALIVAKKPDAKQLLDKLTPYQAFIGVGLLAFGVINLLRALGNHLLSMFSSFPLFAFTVLGITVCSILLGFMFGMPQIAKWMPGNPAAEQKGLELSAKLAPFQVIIGMVGLLAGLLGLLFRLGILTMSY